MEYYSATKKTEILPFVSTWIDVGGIMLSEGSPTEYKCHMISLMCAIYNTKQMNKQTEQK